MASHPTDSYTSYTAQASLSHRGSRAHIRQPTTPDVGVPAVELMQQQQQQRTLRRSASLHSLRRVASSPDSNDDDEKAAPSPPNDASSTHELTRASPHSPSYASEQQQHLNFTVTLIDRLRLRWDEWKTGGAVRRLVLACMAEFMGNVLIALPAGMTMLSGFFLGDYAEEGATARLSIALAILIGVLFALICTQPVAGATLHPSFTIVGALFGIVPYWKVPFFIFSQISGFFLGRMLAAWTYWDSLQTAKQAVIAAGQRGSIFSHTGLAGLFSHFAVPGRHFGYIVLGELTCSFLAAIVVCSCFDASNPFVTPSSAPFVISCAYALFILGWTASSLVGSPAVDIGGRLACWVLFDDGKRCFPMQFSIHAALTPTAGTLLGFIWFLLFLGDSRRPIASSTITAVEQAVTEQARHMYGSEAGSADTDDIYFEPVPLPRTASERYPSFDPPTHKSTTSRASTSRWRPRPSHLNPPRSPASPRVVFHNPPSPLGRTTFSAAAVPRNRPSGYGGAPSPLLRSSWKAGAPSPTRVQVWDRGTFGGSVEVGSGVPCIVEDLETTPRAPHAHLERDVTSHDGDASVQIATAESASYNVGAAMFSMDEPVPCTPSSATHEAVASPAMETRKSEGRITID